MVDFVETEGKGESRQYTDGDHARLRRLEHFIQWITISLRNNTSDSNSHVFMLSWK